MPLYDYQCRDCQRHTEKIQKFSDAPLTECPHCGGHIERVLHAPAVAFKGGGWYADGYGNAKPKSGEAKTGESKSDGKSGETKSTESKSDPSAAKSSSDALSSSASSRSTSSSTPSSSPAAAPASTSSSSDKK